MAFREADIMFAAFDIWGLMHDGPIEWRMPDIIAEFDVTDIPMIAFAMKWLLANGHAIAEFYEDNGLTFTAV